MSKPLILISQIQRSGGTLLSQLFDNHPEILAFPNECYLLKGYWPRLHERYWLSRVKNFKFAKGYLKDFHFDLFEPDDFFWRQYKAEGYQKLSNEKGEIRLPFDFNFQKRNESFFAAMGNAVFPGKRQILDAFFTSFFDGWTNCVNPENSEKKFITAFSPGLPYTMWKFNKLDFFKIYPDGFFLTIVRDPERWLSSARKHSPKYAENALLKYYIPSLRGQKFLLEKFRSRVQIIIFEDLVRDTETVMRNLCKALGISFHPNLLVPTFNGMPIESNSSFSSKKGIDVATIKRKSDEAAKAEEDPALELANKLYNELKNMKDSHPAL